ncbi:alkaline phosphatase PhoX [Colwellia sp. UCD-KL20]|uniref:alkaline phosphatase PhoX n=1 Tax=Colwellia sp. UCD-KL20 TaxID=1917165 RepID=UPI0009711DCB|nr:alkaline phosphatase PhoX [Colwellia sp. UCD-KL20]
MSISAIKTFKLSALAISLVVGLSACDGDDGKDGQTGANGTQGLSGKDGTNGNDGVDGINGQSAPVLTRLATVPTGAEVTGAFLTEEGDLFFNVQHPSDANTITEGVNNKPYDKGTVGVLRGVNFNNLPKTIVNSPVPDTEEERQVVVSALGEYQIIGQTNDTFADLGAKGLPGGLGVHYGIFSGDKIIENNAPDFNGYVSTGEGEGYLFTNWESYPGGVSRMKIEKDGFGNWSVAEAMMVNFDNVGGTAANCFGSVSPWGTPLSSEEWIVRSTVDSTTDASWNDPANTSTDNLEALTAPDFPNPYRYGYTVEITKATSDAPVPVKHYTIGRYEHENSTVMPDRRTVYSSQDDTGGVLFKFIANADEDLSSGTLYGAKLVQDAGSTEPATTGFDVTWIELASGDNATIEAWISEYDGINTSDYVDGETSYMTLADVQAWADGDTNYPSVANGGSAITAGQPMDDRAAFLESRQAAKMKGATAEWRKLEGISINHDRALEAVGGVDAIANEDVTAAYMYMGIADLDNTLIDDEGDIQLSARVKDCGGVYRAKLEENYNLARIEPVVMGSTYRSSLTGALRCDVEQLSQPDNVIVMRDGRIIIGEDGFQENNTLWMYDPKSL